MALSTAVLSAVVVTGAPASAAPEQCQPGWFCMWENNRYTGRFYGLLNADAPNVGDFFNDKMTSYWNRSEHIYLLFEDSRYGGTCMLTVKPGASDSAVEPWQNDKITSARRFTPGDARKFCQG